MLLITVMMKEEEETEEREEVKAEMDLTVDSDAGEI